MMDISRRRFLQFGALTGAGAVLASCVPPPPPPPPPGFNVKDYGAVGDGAANDTAAVDAAIAAAAASSTNRVVFFPAGTYLHDGEWFIEASDIQLLGEAPTTTTLKCRTAPLASAFLTIRADRVTLEALTFNMNQTTFTTTEQSNVNIWPGQTDTHVHNCRFVDFGYYGLAGSGETGKPIQRAEVTGSYFEVDHTVENPANGVSWGGDFWDFKITGNTFVCTGQGAGGIGVGMNTPNVQVKRGNISNNTVSLPSGRGTGLRCGIAVLGLSGANLKPTGMTIANNTITCATEMFGFFSLAMTSSTVTSNTCRMTGTAAAFGTEMANCDHVTVSGNDIDGGGAVPSLIMLNNSNDNTVDNNTLRNPAAGSEVVRVYSDDQYTTDADRNAITNNRITITGANTRGVYVVSNAAAANSDGTNITHNTLTGDGTASEVGVFLDRIAGSVAGTIIDSNTFSNMGPAIRQSGDTGTVIGAGNLGYIAVFDDRKAAGGERVPAHPT
jgi:hypothetical protein